MHPVCRKMKCAWGDLASCSSFHWLFHLFHSTADDLFDVVTPISWKRTGPIHNRKKDFLKCRIMQIFVQNTCSYGMPVAFCRIIVLYDKKLQAFRTSIYFVRIFASFETLLFSFCHSLSILFSIEFRSFSDQQYKLPSWMSTIVRNNHISDS